MRIGDISAAITKGFVAGAVGTAAMTGSRWLEQQWRGIKEPDTAPAAAAAKLLGVEPVNQEARQRFGQLVHWTYGTAWGGLRGLLYLTPLRPRTATAIHLATVWGIKLLALPRLKVVPHPREWIVEDQLFDLADHTVYAVTATVVYTLVDALDRRLGA